MRSLVVYDSKFGNTKKLADAIGAKLQPHGSTLVVSVDSATPQEVGAADLLVIGGPTQAHGMSPPMRRFMTAFTRGSAGGAVAAAFDTRFHGAAILTGSAARSIGGKLRGAGVRLVAEPESFFVRGSGEPVLVEGELARAEAWAGALAELAPAVQHTAA